MFLEISKRIKGKRYKGVVRTFVKIDQFTTLEIQLASFGGRS